ncbi:MAG TPA: D-alanine--D-alanine ligase [Candidatus Dormibacteraeota bacterium]|nr:D-alanine--D-alanine ligase [Candidatus Dormibacteraeota bacterium]
MTALRVAVVCGGRSAENEVSRTSGQQVLQALRARGHQAERIEADEELWDALRGGAWDVAFLALHGRFGEDGTVQGVCELLDVPYTGSSLLATALCLDKAMAKRVLVAEGINTAPWRVVPRHLDPGAALSAMRETAAALGYPLVAKPNRGGSTIGLSIVRADGELAAAYHTAAEHDTVLCERFVDGLEITIGVLGHNPPEALPTLEIVSHRPLYDYAAKYTAGQSEHVIPARLPEEQRRAAQRAAERAHAALGCYSMSRVDVIVDRAGAPWVIEVNAIPGLTELSLLPDAARAAGIGFEDLCDRLVREAVQRHAEDRPI